MRKLLWLALAIALLFVVAVIARRFNAAIEVRESERDLAYAVRMRGEAMAYEFAVDWRRGQRSPSFFLNYLPGERMDWWKSLFAFEVVMAPWQDEIVEVRTHDGVVRESWVAPDGATFCFGDSPRNTNLPFHQHESSEIRGGCPDNGDPRGAKRANFLLDGAQHRLVERPADQDVSLLRSQFRELVIEAEGQELYRTTVDSYDESYLWTAASLATGKIVRIPHGFARFQYFDSVEVIDWRSGESERIELPKVDDVQVPGMDCWLRVDDEGRLLLGGMFRNEHGEEAVWLREYVLESEAEPIETMPMLTREYSISEWGRIRHDWLDLDGRIVVVQVAMAGESSRHLRLQITFDDDSAVLTGLDLDLGDDSGGALLSEFSIFRSPDLDRDGVDDVLCVASINNCPDATHAWWFHSGATGMLLKR